MHRRVRHLNPAQCGAQIALDARFITGVADGAALDAWSARANSTIGATGTGTARPLYRASAIGGRPAVDFDGSNDVMNFDAGALSITNGAQSCDLLCVCVQDASATGANAWIINFSTGTSSTNSRASILGKATVDGIFAAGRRLDTDTAALTTNAGALTSPVIAECRSRWSTGNVASVLNGVMGTPVNYLSGSGSVSSTNSLAATIGTVGTNWFNGKVGAIVMCAPAFSDAVRRRIRHSLGFSFRIATA